MTYYETPRLPMYMLMEEANLVRVRALRYRNGVLDGVLADWDASNIQIEFFGKEYWYSENERPFYCLYKDNGEICRDNISVWNWAVREANQITAAALYDWFMEGAKRVGVPIFDNVEEARDYVFERKKKE